MEWFSVKNCSFIKIKILHRNEFWRQKNFKKIAPIFILLKSSSWLSKRSISHFDKVIIVVIPNNLIWTVMLTFIFTAHYISWIVFNIWIWVKSKLTKAEPNPEYPWVTFTVVEGSRFFEWFMRRKRRTDQRRKGRMEQGSTFILRQKNWCPEGLTDSPRP